MNQEKRESRPQAPGKGLIIVMTGWGKGKTTSALGIVLRAWGQDLRICVIQFIKSEKGRWGETRAAERLGIEWHTLGEGFSWRSRDIQRDMAKAQEGWSLAQRKIISGEYDLIVLDEFTYPIKYGWLDTQQVVEWLAAHKPPLMHLVITGRDAPPALVEFADLVSDVQKIKHPFDQGIPAQRGIEF